MVKKKKKDSVIFCECGVEIDEGMKQCAACEPIECEHCGEHFVFADGYLIDSTNYCANCVIKCKSCKKFVCIDSVGGEDGNYCLDCCVTCDGCERVLTPDDWQEGDDHITVCEDCYGNYYIRCDSCDRIVHSDDSWFCDPCDSSYCRRCYECDHEGCNDRSDLIHDAGYKPKAIFYPAYKPDKFTLYHGIELEVDNSEDIYTLCESLYSMSEGEKLFYLKEDGSLSGDGVEIVTHPRTLEEHKTFIWKDIIKVCVKYGAQSHTGNSCGLHIHSSRAFFERSRPQFFDHKYYKLVYIYDKFFDKLLQFSRRKSTSYCKKPNMLYAMAHINDYNIPTRVNKRLWMLDHQHKKMGKYMAVSLCGNRTIETRLWRGTLKYESLMACLEFTDGVIKFVKDTSIAKIEKMSWEEVVAGVSKYNENEYMLDYMKSRGVI
jgi:hypothetical protein